MSRSNTRRSASAAVAVTALLLLGGCALFQPGLVNCPGTCSIDLDFPADPGRPPETPNPYVRVDAGKQIQFRSSQDAIVVFPKDTPFVDGSGDLIYWFKFTGSTTLTVRNDRSTACVYGNGCKYMVIDAANEDRPVLDPYIIIDR